MFQKSWAIFTIFITFMVHRGIPSKSSISDQHQGLVNRMLFRSQKTQIVSHDEKNETIPDRKEFFQQNIDDFGQTIVNINARANMTRLVDGDIKLPTLRSVSAYAKKWPKNRRGLVEIPYRFSKDFSSKYRQEIQSSLNVFSKHTCIRFVEKWVNHGPYVSIIDGNGCYSSIGMQSYSGQIVSLRLPGCSSKSVVLHEMMHALGFIHEHRRSDRDKYIRINRGEIRKGLYGNFVKTRSKNLVGYDYNSIMHYSSTTFSSKPWLRTIEVIPNGRRTAEIGRAKTLSPYDIENIKYLYDCKPGTYRRCGRDFFNQRAGSFQSPNYPSPYPKESHCTWKITVNRGRFVKVTFKNINIQNSVHCRKDAILVHDGVNAGAPILKRICGKSELIEVVSSQRNMFIIFSSYSRYETKETGFKADFIETSTREKISIIKPASVSPTVVPTDQTVTNFHCNFENGLCGLYQDTHDDFDWIRRKGRGPDRSTGPTADHTTGEGYYLIAHMDNTNLIPTDTAIIRTPWMKNEKQFCITFSYHMFGYLMGELRLYALEKRKNKSERKVLIFRREKNQGREWKKAQINYRPSRYTEFVNFYWKAFRFDWDSDIALDDMRIVSTSCYQASVEKEMIPNNYRKIASTSKTHSTKATAKSKIASKAKKDIIRKIIQNKTSTTSGTTIIAKKHLSSIPGMSFCNFEWKEPKSKSTLGLSTIPINSTLDLGEYHFPKSASTNVLCGWQQLSGTDDKFDWTRYRGETLSDGTGPRSDHTTRKESGYYMYIEASPPRKLNDLAILQTYPMISQQYCINLYYHMHGIAIGEFSVTSVETDKNNQQIRSVLETIKGPQRGVWLHLSANYSPQKTATGVVFRLEGKVGNGFKGDIAVDDVSVIPGQCGACQYPSHSYANELGKQQRFVTGCANQDILWIRCCNFKQHKVVYRHVKECDKNMFSSQRLNWYCSHL